MKESALSGIRNPRKLSELVELRKANTPKEENYKMIEANLIKAIDLTLIESVITKGH